MTRYKGYLITADEQFPSLWKVATEGRGGKIPQILTGRFTAIKDVRSIIDVYSELKETKRGQASTAE